MDILEDKAGWSAAYRNGSLAQFEQSGEINWKLYPHPKNSTAPGVPGIQLAKSRLLFISSAGGYLQDEQQPFDATNPLGDYTIRLFPTAAPFADLAYAHGHYDHAMVEQDAQAALPLRHLETMVDEGKIGELAPSVVSFMGYQPDAARVVDELTPQVVAAAHEARVQAALLAPV